MIKPEQFAIHFTTFECDPRKVALWQLIYLMQRNQVDTGRFENYRNFYRNFTDILQKL